MRTYTLRSPRLLGHADAHRVSGPGTHGDPRDRDEDRGQIVRPDLLRHGFAVQGDLGRVRDVLN